MKNTIDSRRGGAAVATLLALSMIAASVSARAPAASARKAAPAPSTSSAKPPPPPSLGDRLTGAAKVDYEAARVLFDDGDMAGARLKFESAYEASKEPRLLWNMAACEKNLRHYASVAEHLQNYKREGGSKLTPEELAETDDLLVALAPFIGHIQLTVNESGAAVHLDDAPVGTTPLERPLSADIGAHRIRVTKPGYRALEASAQVNGSSDVVLQLTLTKDVHEGRLVVVAGAQDAISVDGTLVGTGRWEGALPSGGHALRVSAPGKRSDTRELLVQDNQTRMVDVTLEPEPKAVAPSGLSGRTWALIVGGGAALVGGIVVGAVLLGKSDGPGQRGPVAGSISPGSVQLPLLK